MNVLTRLGGEGYDSSLEANMKKQAVLALACALVLMSAGFSQQKPIKVLVLYDMEGVSGASSVRHTDFGAEPEYTEARKSLTADVNAAIAGLKAAGATEIVVVDGHGSGNSKEPDVFEAELLPPAKMIARDRSFDIYMDSYDQSRRRHRRRRHARRRRQPRGLLAHSRSRTSSTGSTARPSTSR
jgi:hypothetical protein